jgi:predicted DCC family thiol-disulfide oxidoreductase YuxK
VTAIVIYDGDCGFCTWTARHGRRLLPAEVTVQPWQRSDLPALGLTEDAARRAVQWVPADDGSQPAESRPQAGYRAIASWLIASGLPWSIPGRLLLIPPVSWIAAGCYHVIAANRHRIPGPWRRDIGACPVTKGPVTRGTAGRPW